MMYTFKCKAAGDVTMTQADGDQLLQIIGKSPTAKGIIEVAAIPAAIEALESAIARDEANPDMAGQSASPKASGESTEGEVVELHQRVWPLMEMLKRARDANEVVVWGV